MLDAWLYNFEYLIIWLILLFVVSAIGRKIFRLFKIKLTFAEEIFFAASFGLAGVAYLIYLMGVIGILYRWLIFILLALAIIIFSKEIIKLIKDFWLRRKIFNKIWLWLRKNPAYLLLLIFFVIFIIFNLSGSLAPEIKHDSLWYHLTEAKWYLAENKARIFYPSMLGLSSVAPRLGEMIFTFLMGILPGETLPKLFHFTCGLFFVFGTFLIGRRYFSTKVGILAAFIIYSIQIFGWLSQTAYIDLIVGFYATCMIFGLLLWWQQQGKNELWLAAICMGLTLSVKMLAWFIWPVFLLFIFIRSKKIGTLIKAGFISIVPAFPWYLDIFLATGNPFKPFFVFGSGDEHIGYAKNMTDWLIRVWPETFFQRMSRFFTKEIPIIALLSLVIFYFRKFLANKIAIVLFAFSILSIICWSLIGNQDTRYILPYLAPLAIVEAYLIVEIIKDKIVKIFIGIILAILFIINFLFLYNYTAHSVGAFLGIISRENYRRQELLGNLWNFYDPGWFKENIGANDRVFGLVQNAFYIDFSYYDAKRAEPELKNIKSPDQLQKWLKERGFTYMLFRKPYHLNFLLDFTDIPEANRTEVEKYFPSVYYDKMMDVYKINH